MKKAFTIFVASFAVFCLFSLSFVAFASPAVELVTVADFQAFTETGASMRPTFEVEKTDTSCRIITSTPGIMWHSYRITLNYPAYMTVDSGYYFQFAITTRQNSPSYTGSNLPTTTVKVTTNDGVTYDLGVTSSMQLGSSAYPGYSGNVYVAIAGGYVGNGQPLHISSVVIDSNCPVGSISSGIPSNYDITFYPSISVVPTPEQERHEELMGEIQQSTTDITDSIDESTDKITDSIEQGFDGILNGYEADDSAKDDLDDATADLEDAESDIFGDKSKDDLTEQVEGAFDESVFGDLTNMASASVTAYINSLLFTLGPEYSALIFLSCGLGISLLAIGRVL